MYMADSITCSDFGSDKTKQNKRDGFLDKLERGGGGSQSVRDREEGAGART
jgi:hypothetical protein